MLPSTFTSGLLGQLELLRIRNRRTFLGSRQGGHISLKRGHGIEFSDYRKYELGDNPRDIDWGVYARSERLYVKRFQEEQDLSVFVAIDGSASMGVPKEDRKWERSVEAALALSYVALMSQDSVLVAATSLYESPLLYGGRSFHTLARGLQGVTPKGGMPLSQGLRKPLNRIRFPGVAVVISDFLMPIEEIIKAFNLLRAKNLDITAIQILGPRDIEPLSSGEEGQLVDAETGERISMSHSSRALEEYTEMLRTHIASIEDFCRDSQITFLATRSDSDLSAFLMTELPHTGLLST